MGKFTVPENICHRDFLFFNKRLLRGRLAWFVKALNLVDAGDLRSAQAAISQAQTLDYRLPARDRSTLKFLQYRLSGQQEKLVAFLKKRFRTAEEDESRPKFLDRNVLVTPVLALHDFITGKFHKPLQ